MFVMAACSMGYDVIVLDPDADSPAGSMAAEHLQSAYTDKQALDYMAGKCAVITTEFENIPSTSLQYLSQKIPVHPSAQALSIAQNRIREKTFIQSLGLLTSPFIAIDSEQDLSLAEQMVYPAILKTATQGYDGKGQIDCRHADDVVEAFLGLKTSCVLEQRITLEKEISVVLARNEKGETFCFPVAENEHSNGILDVSLAPASISPALTQQVQQAATTIADGMKYCGVLAVEFFISKAGELLVNEIAPRPHNSGHYTLDACYGSQFEQQIRMICGLPSVNCELHTPVAMLNLLGDVWPETGIPDWQGILNVDKARLHLYGKKHARAGRKMGHVNVLDREIHKARDKLMTIKARLSRRNNSCRGFTKSVD